ncbi:MAG: amidohydrolase [Acidobacteria bacterium]|nr:amidohydrolase [Acidobacteriota bacterium]
MRNVIVVPLVLMVAGLAAVELNAAPRPEIDAQIEALAQQCIALRRTFHQYPELSNREVETSRRIADQLRHIGIPIETGIARTGIVGDIRGGLPGPTVAVRADIDALPIEETIDVPYKSRNPGVKHACGHDSHIAIGLTVAEVLWKNRETLPGRVIMIFQPAEEGPPPGEKGGAPLMLEEGIFEKYEPEAIFALHAWPALKAGTVGVRPGPFFASSDTFSIRVEGKQSHGAQPHLGVDPIVASAQIVTALQTIDARRVDPTEPVVVSIGIIRGGTRFNVIPPLVEMEGTLRTLSPAVRDLARDSIHQIVEDTAKAVGASASVSFADSSNPPTVNDPELSEMAIASLRSTLGSENVVMAGQQMVAEDFAHFAEAIPGFYYVLGVGNPERGITANLHTAEFDIDESALTVGAKAMTNLVLDYLEAGS